MLRPLLDTTPYKKPGRTVAYGIPYSTVRRVEFDRLWCAGQAYGEQNAERLLGRWIHGASYLALNKQDVPWVSSVRWVGY